MGIVIALLATNRSIFLIDEPEVFLHPPQAFRMGQFLAENATDTRQIIVSSHSTDLLQGIVSKTRKVNIIRIERQGNTNYFRLLNPERLKEIINDPLLSSARVLDGLFYSGAIVVEADSDARFYHSASNKCRKNADFHFVNADNKQTVSRIRKMYQDMGVRCAGIVDFDVLNDYTEFNKQLDALELSDDETQKALEIQKLIGKVAKEVSPDERLDNSRTKITEILNVIDNVQKKEFDSPAKAMGEKNKTLQFINRRCRELSESNKDWKDLKQKGRDALPEDIQSKFEELRLICAKKGLFINPYGELESMLSEHGIQPTDNKRVWITQALQLLPELQVDYQKNLWKFIKEIHEYILGTK